MRMLNSKSQLKNITQPNFLFFLLDSFSFFIYFHSRNVNKINITIEKFLNFYFYFKHHA
jgi:hypothetical protein